MQTYWVDLIEWDPITRSGWIAVRVFIENGKVKFDGDANVIDKLRKDSTNRDPLEFLQLLSKTYRNLY